VLLIAFLYLWLKFWEGIDKYWIVLVRKLFYFHHCVHADAHLSVALVCYLNATGAETSMLLNCILQGWAIVFGAQELL